MPIERAIVNRIGWIRRGAEGRSVPLEKAGGRIFVDAAHHQYFSVDLECRGAIRDADQTGEIGTSRPRLCFRVVDRGMTSAASVGPGSEHGAIWPQVPLQTMRRSARRNENPTAAPPYFRRCSRSLWRDCTVQNSCRSDRIETR